MAGSKRATRIPMIAITTSNSTSVNARFLMVEDFMFLAPSIAIEKSN
jgi:hypothetical protein